MREPYLVAADDQASKAFPILYSFRRCPYAMRARLAMAVSQTAYLLREVKISAKPEALLAASPKGTVPVLVLRGGTVIEESLDIMRWVLDQRDPEGWLAGDDSDLIDRTDGPFQHDLDRYKYPDRHGTDPFRHRASGMAFLRELNERLAHAAQLCGATRTLTDAAIFPFVRQFAAVDQTWFADQPLPHLKRWLADHMESALFAMIMFREKPWVPSDQPLLFAPPAQT